MSKVPVKFQAFLPSSQVNNLEIDRDSNYIIENLLMKANLDAWKWMLNNYSVDEVRHVLINSKRLRPKDVYFWTYYLEIPKDQVLCIQTKSPNTLKSSWEY